MSRFVVEDVQLSATEAEMLRNMAPAGRRFIDWSEAYPSMLAISRRLTGADTAVASVVSFTPVVRQLDQRKLEEETNNGLVAYAPMLLFETPPWPQRHQHRWLLVQYCDAQFGTWSWRLLGPCVLVLNEAWLHRDPEAADSEDSEDS
jgi:hypothetical protein